VTTQLQLIIIIIIIIIIFLVFHNSTMKFEAIFSSEIVAHICHNAVTSHEALNFIESAGKISNLRQPMHFLNRKARPTYLHSANLKGQKKSTATYFGFVLTSRCWYKLNKKKSVSFIPFSQNCKKRLLATSCLSVCLLVRIGKTRLPLDGFS